MNGTEPKIEIFSPFGAAFELMKRILFQPFDFTKWLVIGFAAFLSNLSSGSNFNYGSDWTDKGDWSFRSVTHNGSSEWLSCALPVLVGVVLLLIAIGIALYWVGCRGRFIFVDCIVRNRGAIVEPWREYRHEGNSFFLFSLLVGLGVLVIVGLVSIPVWLPFAQGWTEGAGFVATLTIGIVLLIAVIVVLALSAHLIFQLMVPVMYRQRCRALPAFREVGRLILANPAPLTLYLLFFIVLTLGAAAISCASMPLTCCITLIPYVGTVILLPVFVVLAAFPLLFLRQFGDAYDVWAAVEVPQPLAAPPPPPDSGPTAPPLPPVPGT